jgi:hypothetical protein
MKIITPKARIQGGVLSLARAAFLECENVMHILDVILSSSFIDLEWPLYTWCM